MQGDQVAKLAGLHDLAHAEVDGVEAVVEGDAQPQTSGVRRLHHAGRLGRVHSHGLFHQHVLAALQGRQCLRTVQVYRRRHVHGVQPAGRPACRRSWCTRSETSNCRAYWSRSCGSRRQIATSSLPSWAWMAGATALAAMSPKPTIPQRTIGQPSRTATTGTVPGAPPPKQSHPGGRESAAATQNGQAVGSIGPENLASGA